MQIPKWSDNTREERFFTAMLFGQLLGNADPFWQHLAPRVGVSEETRVIDVGYEVCLFRDLAHARHISPSSELRKQTIDLVLTLSNNAVVLIEAKAHQGFSIEQLRNMQRAGEKLRAELGATAVHLAGLHSSQYNPARVREAYPDLALTTWRDIRGLYPSITDHVDRADEIYGN